MTKERNMPPVLMEKNAVAEYLKVEGVDMGVAVARHMGKRPEDVVFLNEASQDGLKFRPVLNSELLNVLFEDFEPGAIYKVGRLWLRKTIVVDGVTDAALTQRPFLRLREWKDRQ